MLYETLVRSASDDVRGQNDFCKGVSSLFAGIGNGNASENSADAAVPNLCSLPPARGGLPAASHRVHVVTRLYLRFTFMCFCGPDLTGAL